MPNHSASFQDELPKASSGISTSRGKGKGISKKKVIKTDVKLKGMYVEPEPKEPKETEPNYRESKN